MTRIEVFYVLRVEHPTDPDRIEYVADVCGHDISTERWQCNAKEWPTRSAIAAELEAAELEADGLVLEVVELWRIVVGRSS
jgi:hypothetical protein